jgi:CBS-domain-containing membrane protein
MFHVFGVNGRLSTGGLEQLRQVGSVRGVSRTRALAHSGLAVDGEEHLHLGEGPRPGAHGPVAAYASVQQQVGDAARQPLSRVEQVMSRAVISVRADQSLQSAWQHLAEQGVAQAPVLAAGPSAGAGAGPLVGLLWSAELLRPAHWPPPEAAALAWQLRAQALWGQPVSEVMITPVPAVPPDADLRRVAAALLQWRLPGLPVADEHGRLLGFVSRTNLLQALVADPPLDLWS